MGELLFSYVSILLAVLIYFLIAFNLYPYQLNKKLAVLSILVVYIGSILFGMTFKFFVPFFCIFIASSLFYFSKKQIYISIIFATLGEFILFSSDLFISNIFGIFFRNQEMFNSNQIYMIVCSSTIGIFAYIISLYLGKRLKGIFNFEELNKISLLDKFLTSILLLYSVIILLLNINLLISKGYDTKVVLLFSLLFLAYIILIAVILFRVARNIKLNAEVSLKNKELENKEKLLTNLKDYTSELEFLYENMRVFRHDYINILSTMSSYMDEKEWSNLEAYFKEKILPIGKEMNENNYRLGFLKNLKIMELKGILSTKVILAQEKDIDCFVDIAEEINLIPMDTIDLCKSIGIILDNAIEAALQSEERFIKCAVVKRELSVLIVVCNSYRGEKIDIRKIFEKGFTTKTTEGKRRGLGLYTLNKVVDAHSNVTLETEITANEFNISMEIFKSS